MTIRVNIFVARRISRDIEKGSFFCGGVERRRLIRFLGTSGLANSALILNTVKSSVPSATERLE